MQPVVVNHRGSQCKWGLRVAIVAFGWSLLAGGEAFAQSPTTC